MEELFREIFTAFPDKSTIVFKGKCFDCEKTVKINIIPTLEGFGLLGGAFVECSKSEYVTKCPDCYKINFKVIEPYKKYRNVLTRYNKKSILDSILIHIYDEDGMWHNLAFG